MTPSSSASESAGSHRIRCSIITVSDSLSLEDDESGQLMVRLLEQEGHPASERTVVPADPGKVALVLRHWLSTDDVDAILLCGAGGAPFREGTVDVVRRFLDVELPGFAELLRSLGFQQFGAAAMWRTAVAGFSGRKVLFALPGSPRTVQLALEKLILPELRYLVRKLRET